MKQSLSLALFAGINIVLGFATNWLILTTLGAGPETDALYAGLVVPNLMLVVFSGSLRNVLVPILSVQQDSESNRVIWTVFQSIGIFYGVLAFVLYGTGSVWAPWTVPGFDSGTQDLTVTLLRIHLIGMLANALLVPLTSLHNANHRFLIVEIASAVASLLGFLLLVWSLPRYGVEAAAWTMVAKSFFQVFWLAPSLGAYNKPEWKNESVITGWRRLRPLLAGNLYFKSDQLVDAFLASLAPRGNLSLFFLARQVYTYGHQTLGKAIANPAFTLLSKLAHKEDWQSFLKLSNQRTGWMLALTGGGFLCVLFFGKPVLTLIFGHGRFDESSITLLWYLLIALVGFWAGGSMGQILSSSFYSKGNTLTPTKIGAVGFTLGIFFKIAGFHVWGIIGIAIGTSAYYLLNLFWLNYKLQARVKNRLALSKTPL